MGPGADGVSPWFGGAPEAVVEVGASEGGGAAAPSEEGGAPMSRELARQLAAAAMPEVPTLRYFIERGGTERRTARGHCAQGICECFPPYRGHLCEQEDPPRLRQDIRAVIHYILAETASDLDDIERSLSTLWIHYNRHLDYPVVIFHEGLSPSARQRIVYASENRVWLVLLPNFNKVPPEWVVAAHELGQDFSVGYRAMTRWRSGPVFLEPALAEFDYAMTLDTDSYFPAVVKADPFEFLQKHGLIAAFPHLGRESASVVVNFMHYFLLYCKLKGLHPRRTRMIAALIETNYKWYQQCLMLDMEVLRLDWFRSDAYQDMFRYMDSTGGFWLYRWGNNPFRTFAVTLLLEDGNVRSLDLPYAHQDFCSCGPGAAPCEWNAERGLMWCMPVASEESVGIAAGDLAEALLDLQPWRGTERQRRQFQAEEIREFVLGGKPP